MDRCFYNPYEDYRGGAVSVDGSFVRNLINEYVATILMYTNPAKAQRNADKRGDLYVGNAGIAYMFLRLHQSQHDFKELQPLVNAQLYINDAKSKALPYVQSRSRDERCSFLCGNAGIYCVAAVISAASNNLDEMKKDLEAFETGYEACKPMHFSRYGSDEVLVGRAGYLSGMYWLNKQLMPQPFADNRISELCQVMVDSGRQYSADKGSPFPLMYHYHGTEYLGAAHGLCSILHMMLESPWFKRNGDAPNFTNISKTKLLDIKNSIDGFVALQDHDGNFPCAMEDLGYPNDNPLIHWCHGAPGAIYLLIKAYLVFREEKYLNSCRRAADLIWHYGLLRKGPGICHGVAGNGYAFLIMYRLTGEVRYMHRATKFAEFLKSSEFLQRSRTPDCPFSLYEGLAGTVCFLIDLLEPQRSCFPFMDVF
ncbi:hypothetical protein HA402_014582 [Bradysia odoriphaga]|nr:hypothetical protein HA402_014582 [Bradysia odoriphaga]